ncbi:MAG: ATP-binding/permease protein CydD [Paracidovorax wautersii]|uniref:ATP-binding/permease protein CydD n=1 Tax=Paracidovorax wautersii TaxID=1177982 RepID=A0A7V8FRT9_9BURK|nr:MAG: ATP-binding/permease protein CydD [Paracidovorax wautersii]
MNARATASPDLAGTLQTPQDRAGHGRSAVLGYRPSRLGAALVTGSATLWLGQAAAIAAAVQGLLDGRGMAAVWPMALAVLLLGVLRAAGEAWGARLLFVQARAHVSALRAQSVAALAGRSPLDAGRTPSGQAASVLAEQAEAILPYLVRYLPVQQRVMVLPWLIAAVVAWQSWVCALVLLLAAPLIPLFMALVGWRAQAASQAQLAEMGGMNAFLLDRLRGLTTLRALGAVDATALRLRAAAHALQRRTMRVLRIAFLSSAVLELFSALGVALVAVYVGFHLLGYLPFGAWGHQLTLGQGLFVLLLASAFFEPLRDLSGVWHDRASGAAALASLQALAQRGTALPGADGEPVAMPATAPALRLRDLSVAHPGAAEPVFEHLSLDVAAGERIALMGPSGSGKSTLLAAIAGLLPLQAGRMALGDVWLTPEHLATARAAMGWIGQKPHLFAGTVQDNVALGRPGVDRAAVDGALAWAQLGRVAQAHAGSALGEGGVGLSGGEAVRLALARVAADPSVRLILADEPTAHLDRETAADVTRALLALAQGLTLIVATHDAQLARALDRQVDLAALRSAGGPP